MLPEFFRQASKLVLRPIVDSTGQSVHVDGDLGGTNSTLRKDISHVLERVAKRMDNASFAQSAEQWRGLFERED
jgi:hypothetical protein